MTGNMHSNPHRKCSTYAPAHTQTHLLQLLNFRLCLPLGHLALLLFNQHSPRLVQGGQAYRGGEGGRRVKVCGGEGGRAGITATYRAGQGRAGHRKKTHAHQLSPAERSSLRNPTTYNLNPKAQPC